MKLALIGRSIAHSSSPLLYRKILGSEIQYDLIDIQDESQLPSLEELASRYQGINLTAPYKKFYLKDLKDVAPEALSLNAINTISLGPSSFRGINTDYFATEAILIRFLHDYPKLHLLILGSGVMANLTKLLCEKYGISFNQVSRSNSENLSRLNVETFHQAGSQLLIINACSRNFIFQGHTTGEELFWDYNYKFLPHQNTLPFRIKSYWDGQEMLYLQALHAAKFWRECWP